MLHDLLERRESLGIDRIHAVVRPTAEASAEKRLQREVLDSPALASLLGEAEGRVQAVSADLAEPGQLAEATRELAPRLGGIVHCAASVEFDLPLAEAMRANVDGALAVLDLAKSCPTPPPLVSVSTAYVTPHPGNRARVQERLAPLPRPASQLLEAIREGRAHERALLRESGHPNTYTFTKCLAEHLLVEARGQVPLTLLRPSIIAASWKRPFPGWIDSPAAFALFIMSIGLGHMRAIVGRARARIDLVPCDEVAERVVNAVAEPPEPEEPRIVHAVAGVENAILAGTCRDVVDAWFQRNPVTTSRQGPAGVHYLGPPGLRYRFHHWRHHQRRSGGHLVAPRLDETNRRFAYFTSNTFRFESAAPLRAQGFEAKAYLERICRGVSVHLLDADMERLSLGGRRHPRATPLRAKGRLAELEARAEHVTFDLPSFERALAGRRGQTGGRLVLVPVEDGEWNDAALELLAWARSDLWATPPRVSRSARASGEARRWDELYVHVEHRPAKRDEDGLGRFHLRCETLLPGALEEDATRPSSAELAGPAEGAWAQDQA